MKAMIFAAGLGTRLRPLTDNCPKALIEVGGKPMLQHVISRLKHAGVTEIVINVHHLASMITDFLSANNNFGITIHISDESDLLLDTGGGILNARHWLDDNEPFFVHNADILTDINLPAMMDLHKQTNADVTLAVSRRASSRMLYFDNRSNQLCGWMNTKTGETKPQGFQPQHGRNTARAFGGVHIITPHIFTSLAEYATKPVFSIIPYYLSVCNTMNIRSYEQATPYSWFDIGKPDTLEAARQSAIALID